MSSPGTSPPVFCPDFALSPRGASAGKRPLPFGRPINLLKFGSANGAPGVPTQQSRVVVLNLDGHLYIRDLTGNAELRWNDQPVIEAELRHGDRVRLGKVEYDVVATRCAASTPQSPTRAELRGGGSSQPVRTPVTLLAASKVADVRLGGTGPVDACALIVRVGDRFWLWNLEPASEPRVNGRPAARAELTDGSMVAIGGSEFRLHVGPAPAAAAPPTPTPAPAKAPAQIPEPAPASGIGAKSASVEVPPVAMPSGNPIGATAAPKTAPAAPKPAPKSPASAPTPAHPTPRARGIGSKTLREDDARAIKGWGPLALAVAAADRPELQGGPVQAPQVSQPPAPVEATGARPRRRWTGIVLSAVAVVTGAAAGAVFAWQHWKR